jgi:hypothetical protein
VNLKKRLPPPAHQVMLGIIPGLDKFIMREASRIRKKKGNADRAIPFEEASQYKPIQDFSTNYARDLYESKLYDPDDAISEANILGHHICCFINFELHRRKIFWVEESLAWMFLQTQLDIEGECLRLPFPSCAFIFTDRHTLEVAEKVLNRDEACGIRGHELEILSVYLIEHPALENDATILTVNLYFDAQTGDWPYGLSRSLYIRPKDHLEKILESHCPDVSPDTREPIYTIPEMKHLIHLIFNAILYATTAHLDRILIRSPVKNLNQKIARRGSKKRAKLLRQRDLISENTAIDDVFYLPGKIDISRIKHIRQFDETSEGRAIAKRFMVRGHWRQANPSWKDQSLRWIEPYWKGPEDAIGIQKEYRMKL